MMVHVLNLLIIQIVQYKNSTVLLRESVKDVRRKTLAEKIEAKAKLASSAKGKKK